MRLIFCLTFLVSFKSLGVAFPGPKDFAVNGCRIFDAYQVERKVLPGERCIFLNNGDFIASNTGTIRYFTARDEIKWTVKGVFHHQLNLTTDKNRILAIGSVLGSLEQEEPKRYDQLLVIGMDGKVLQTMDMHTALVGVNTRFPPMHNPFKSEINVPFEGSHVNSFYEIPPLKKGVKVPSYAQPGNYIINSLALGVLFIDKDLKKILATWVSPYATRHNTHDAQITTEGKLIYFNNLSANSANGNYHSTIDEVDLMTKQRTLEIKSNPGVYFYSRNCGGVQVLNDDLIMFSHVIVGYYVYSRATKSIIYSGNAPFAVGERLVTAQQIKIMDLTEFLKNR